VFNIGTSNVDTVCEVCDAAADRRYSVADDYGRCKTHTPCVAGSGVSVAGTDTSDTQCQACVAAAGALNRIGSYSASTGYGPCVAHRTCPLGSGCAGPASMQAPKLVGYWESKSGGFWGNDWNWEYCGKRSNCAPTGGICNNEVKCKEAPYKIQTNGYCNAPRGNGQMKLAYVVDNINDETNAFGGTKEVKYMWYVPSPCRLLFTN